LHYLSHGDLIAKPNISRLNDAEVVFDDGSREKIDLILYATGYRWELPYLEEGLIRWEEEKPDLYMNVFSREHPALFVLGLAESNVAAYQMFDQLADLIARVLLAQQGEREEARRFANLLKTDRPQLGGGISYVASPRHVGYVDFSAFESHIDRVRRYIGWPPVRPGSYKDVLKETSSARHPHGAPS
jgi:hypothetical protein